MSKQALKRLQKQFKSQVLDTHDHCGNETAIVSRDGFRAVCEFLRSDEKMAFDYLSDVTAVDFLARVPRYEVVYHFYSMTHRHRLRIKVPLAEGDEHLPTVSDLWRAANWGEREVFDMYGIRFDGHPDLRRILLYDEFQGHPLRKDYPKQLSQPRMDLRRKERDAVEEYQHYFVEGETNTPSRR